MRGFLCVIFLIAFCGDFASPGAPPRFQKVSEHCYYLPMDEGGNVGAVITDEGILMVNPPQEPERALVADALSRISSKAVRWIIFTDPRYAHSAGARHYAEEGAQVLASARQNALSARMRDADVPNAEKPESKSGSSHNTTPPFPWIVFERQMRVFPSNVEVRVFAIQNNACTGGDVVVHVPDEKVLFVGDLYVAARYPDIAVALGGSAQGWIEGIKEVIDSIRLLKPAIPQEAPGPKLKAEREKTLEEGIAVVSAQGGTSNLQNMKDLLEAAQKLRNDISRAIRTGRSSDSYLAGPGSGPYRSYDNLDSYATLLFEALSK